MRDLREVATLDELLHEVLLRVEAGVQAIRSAVIIDGTVEHAVGISKEEATLWLNGFSADPEKKLCDSDDAVFRVRVPLVVDGQKQIGWLVVGPRPDGTTIRDDEQDALVGIAEPDRARDRDRAQARRRGAPAARHPRRFAAAAR